MEVFETEYWCEIGHFNKEQALEYQRICQNIRPKTALEIGFCTGRSASCVLFYASDHLQKLISVDKNLDWKEPGRAMANLLGNRFRQFKIIESSSRTLLTPAFFEAEFVHGIDLITIDGDHSFEGCTSDLNAVSPYLTRNGRIIVDDYFSGPPNGVDFESVNRSVDLFLSVNSNAFMGERWHNEGKGFCIIKRR